jgi:hypothetical protein
MGNCNSYKPQEKIKPDGSNDRQGMASAGVVESDEAKLPDNCRGSQRGCVSRKMLILGQFQSNNKTNSGDIICD